jgi:uncharacterized membrane protein YkoI
VYEVEFEQEGPNAQIHIGEDGSLVKGERPREGVGTSLFGFYLGTQLEDTPAAVQETIRREANGRQIVDIDKELRTGAPVYEVHIKEPAGSFELHIAESGTVLSDSRRSEAMGTPGDQARAGTGRGSERAAGALTVRDLPVDVQNQIRIRVDPASVKHIQRQTVYEIEFEQDGRQTRLQVAEDGTVVKEARR